MGPGGQRVLLLDLVQYVLVRIAGDEEHLNLAFAAVAGGFNFHERAELLDRRPLVARKLVHLPCVFGKGVEVEQFQARISRPRT